MKIRILMVVTLLATGLLSACTTTEASRALLKQTNELAMSCYLENEGSSYAFGNGPTWLACKEWAQGQVGKLPK
ncbi:MAG: hypothetical protein O7G86_00035 [Gammaproteobacteria bacterium]|nr:hypothetical protein [Gammaproteobacteria bacterium]